MVIYRSDDLLMHPIDIPESSPKVREFVSEIRKRLTGTCYGVLRVSDYSKKPLDNSMIASIDLYRTNHAESGEMIRTEVATVDVFQIKTKENSDLKNRFKSRILGPYNNELARICNSLDGLEFDG